MAESPEDIAYQEALRSIGGQQTRLDNLRTRAATLLAAAAIATSFLGAEALRDTRLTPKATPVADRSLQLAELVAIASFIGVGIACLYILWPRRKRWLFRMKADRIVAQYVDGDKRKTVPAIQRDLALHMEGHYQKNAAVMERLFWSFQFGVLCLGVEVLSWLVDLA